MAKCDANGCDLEATKISKSGMFFAEYCEDHDREAETARLRSIDRRNQQLLRNKRR